MKCLFEMSCKMINGLKYYYRAFKGQRCKNWMNVVILAYYAFVVVLLGRGNRFIILFYIYYMTY